MSNWITNPFISVLKNVKLENKGKSLLFCNGNVRYPVHVSFDGETIVSMVLLKYAVENNSVKEFEFSNIVLSDNKHRSLLEILSSKDVSYSVNGISHATLNGNALMQVCFATVGMIRKSIWKCG